MAYTFNKLLLFTVATLFLAAITQVSATPQNNPETLGAPSEISQDTTTSLEMDLLGVNDTAETANESPPSLEDLVKRKIIDPQPAERTIGNQFMKTLTLKLLENSSWLPRDFEAASLLEDESVLREIHQFEIYEGESTDIHHVRRNLAIQAGWTAMSETFDQTRLGRRIKKLEQRLSRYFFMEYTKSFSKDTSHFILPGDATEEPSEDSEFKVALYYFSADAAAVKGNYAVYLACDYFDYMANAKYNFGKQEFSLNLTNLALNARYQIGGEIECIFRKDGAITNLLKISLPF